MAVDFKAKYGTANQTITITLASLASGSARGSTAITNATNLFLDAHVQLKIKTGAASTSATGYVRVLVYGSVDGGTVFSGATGTDAAITLIPSNLRSPFSEVDRIQVAANATTYYSRTISIAEAFGGQLPERWGIIVDSVAGGTLDTSGSNFTATYQGVYAQSV